MTSTLNLIPEITTRRSVRAYQSKSVSPEQIEQLLEAARWAPSSNNGQPWRYIVAVKGEDAHQKISDSLLDFNKVWAPNAPVLMISLAKKQFDNGNPNRHALFDTGAANAFLSLEATHIGLQVHQMGGFIADILRSSFNISDEYEIASVIAVGYPGEADSLPSPLKERETAPRVRKSLEEIVVK